LRFFPDGQSVLTFDYANHEIFARRVDLQTGDASTVFHQQGRNPWVHWQPALSPDGKTLFYSAEVDRPEKTIVTIRLVRRNLQNAEEKDLLQLSSKGTGAFSIMVSPDGRQVAFTYIDQNNATWLMTVPSDGGTARPVYQGVATTLGTAWTKDGGHLLFLGQQLSAIPAEGGVPQSVGISMDVQGFALNPQNSRIAFLGGQSRTDLGAFRNLLPPGPAQQ
jgi:Tol biopolymer transport system component